MDRSPTLLNAALGVALTLSLLPREAQAGWQGGRQAKCVKPDSAITTEQQQSLSAAVRGGTVVWNASGQVDQASASAATHQVLSQGMFEQAWIRYELCVALDNNRIDQATYNRLLEQSLQGSMGGPSASASTSASQPSAPTPPAPTMVTAPATVPSGSTEWVEQIRNQTQLRSGPSFANMAAYGYSLRDVAATGLLDASTGTRIPLSLPSGYEYAIMGVCDNDCSDLDLAVFKGGVSLAVDTSQDDWPVVPLTPTGTSGYELEVAMYQCSAKNCGYQVTIWQRPLQGGGAVASSAASGNGVVSIQSGSQLRGGLGSGDHTLPNGEWADRYALSVRAGQSLVASMASSDIDTYLVALSPAGVAQENDDCNGDRARSCLNFVAQESGVWTIYATSYQANDDGSYTLQAEVQ